MKPAFLSLIVLLACLGIVQAAFFQHIVIHNTGTLSIPTATTVTLTIYNDTGLQTHANLTGIGPSAFAPSDIYSDYSYRTVYGVLTANKTGNVTLNVYTINWNPQAANDYMTLYAFRNVSSTEVVDFNGTTLEADPTPTVMEMLLTLYIPTDSLIKTFTFDIRFTATAEP